MRLIDADAFREQLDRAYEYTELGEVIEMLDNAPAVEPFEPDHVGAERLEARQRGYEAGYHEEMKIGKTLNPQIKHGEWITTERGYECSECGALHSDDYPFCHMCGADMRDRKGG